MLDLHLSLRLIEIFSVIVPSSMRREWKDEWLAKLYYYGETLQKSVLFRASGAMLHALWLRGQEWRIEADAVRCRLFSRFRRPW